MGRSTAVSQGGVGREGGPLAAQGGTSHANGQANAGSFSFLK